MIHRNTSKCFFRVKRTKGNFFNIISNWKWLSVEIGYMALLVAFDIPSEFDVLLAACGWCRAAVPPSPPHSALSLKIVNNDFLNLHYERKGGRFLVDIIGILSWTKWVNSLAENFHGHLFNSNEKNSSKVSHILKKVSISTKGQFCNITRITSLLVRFGGQNSILSSLIVTGLQFGDH